MLTEEIPQLKSLTLAQKRRLIGELIDEVFGQPVGDPELVSALNSRLAHFRKNPQSAKSWAEVKKRLRRSH